MSKTESDLQSFTTFVHQRLASEPSPPPTLPELFELWQTEQPKDAEYWDTVESLKRAYADIGNPDRWSSPEENIAKLRRELGLPEE